MIFVNLKKKQVVVKDSTLLASIAILILILFSLFLQVDSSTKRAATLHAISIEEREVVFTVIEKMEREPRLSAFVSWLTETLNEDISAVLVSNSKSAKAVELRNEGTLVFSQRFFSADPISQELALVKILADAGNSNSDPKPPTHPPELAILPQ